MIRRHLRTASITLLLALSLSACGAQTTPTTELPTAVATVEAAPEPSTVEPSSPAPEIESAEATTDAEAEAQASRAAEQERAETILAAMWGGQDPQWQASVCHYWTTGPDEFRDGLVDGLTEGADFGLTEEIVSAYLVDACADLEQEWAATATDTDSYAELTKRELALVAKDPDSYAGDRFVVYGHISQFDAATGTEAFRTYIDTVQHGRSYDFDQHIMAQAGEPGLFDELVEGDIVRMHVQVLGAFSYDTQIGGNTTVPMVRVNVIEAVGFDG